MLHEIRYVDRSVDEYGDYYNVAIKCGKKNRKFTVVIRDVKEKIYCPYCGRELKIEIKALAELEEV